MLKLQRLTQYLLSHDMVRLEQVDSVAQAGTLVPDLKDTESGLRIGFWRYTGVIEMERYKGQPEYLMAVVLTWLHGNDTDREDLSQPGFDIDPPNDNGADLDITVEFQEPVYLVEDENGPFEVNGERYGLGDYDLWIAEKGEVTHDADQPN